MGPPNLRHRCAGPAQSGVGQRHSERIIDGTSTPGVSADSIGSLAETARRKLIFENGSEIPQVDVAGQ